MPLSAFQQFCADTGCPDNVHTLALWTQRNDAVAEQERLKQSLYAAHESITYWMKSSDVLLAEVTKLKAEREQMEKQEPISWERDVSSLAGWINELRLLGQHRNLGERWIREAIRTIAFNLEKHYAHPPVPDGKVLVDKKSIGSAISAMEEAKLLPIWDNGVPNELHKRLDVIFAMLKAAQQGE